VSYFESTFPAWPDLAPLFYLVPEKLLPSEALRDTQPSCLVAMAKHFSYSINSHDDKKPPRITPAPTK